ncbi:hypothetical protein MUP77_12660, partial [Candidatus Bathyarchaeota archaeon]|nr:hypothetical protein [Candidatus Bathyarchaeota archaeon]
MDSQPAVEFKVNRVVWGQTLNTPATAYPGNTGVALTIEVQNYSNETIKGVEAKLLLAYPFTDSYGKLNATATGQPSVGSILSPTDLINATSFFTLTFSLNINPNALPTSYTYEMVLNYFIKSQTLYLKGQAKTVSVEFTISKIATAMTCT